MSEYKIIITIAENDDETLKIAMTSDPPATRQAIQAAMENDEGGAPPAQLMQAQWFTAIAEIFGDMNRSGFDDEDEYEDEDEDYDDSEF